MATFCLFAVLFWRPEGERLVGVLDGRTGSSGSLSLPWTVSSSSPSQKDSQWHSLSQCQCDGPSGWGWGLFLLPSPNVSALCPFQDRGLGYRCANPVGPDPPWKQDDFLFCNV